MWSYYGSKSRIAHLYPKPRHERIIEPFAGTARYSLLHWDHDITIIDKYEVIVKIWSWLQKCSPKDILDLPHFKQGESISREMFNCDEEFLLMGFLVAKGFSTPRKKVSRFSSESHSGQGMKAMKKSIARNIHKCKNWNIIHGSYECLENIEATWYIDPPYQFGGESYKESNKNLDYQSLADWCRSRRGQVIVCENTKANWLPFRPMKKIVGSAFTYTTEAIWSNLPTDYDVEQLNIFNLLGGP